MNRTLLWRWALAVVLLVAPSNDGMAQDASRARPADTQPAAQEAAEAQRVLLSVFPELRDHRIDWRIDGSGTTLVLEARIAVPPLADAVATTNAQPEDAQRLAQEQAAPLTPPLLRALVERDVDGRLVSLQTEGDLARPAAFRAAQVAGRPLEALAAAGAQYRPDVSAGSTELVPPQLAHLLGSADVPPARFAHTAPADPENLTWQVVLHANATTKGQAHTYILVFEPVQGRLLSLVRR